MEEQLIEFSTGQIAKTKGFNVPCDARWWIEPASNWKESKQGAVKCKNSSEDSIARPTQSLLQKWLREVHKIAVLVDFDKNQDGEGIMYVVNWQLIEELHKGGYSEKQYSTYEEALEVGLQEGLKHIQD